MTQSQLIAQRDGTVLVAPGDDARRVFDVLRQFAQLERVVAGSYVYRVSPVAIWGSAARGRTLPALLAELRVLFAGDVPSVIVQAISALYVRWGALRLVERDHQAVLTAGDPSVFAALGPQIAERAVGGEVLLGPEEAAPAMLAAAQRGWPVVDLRRALAAELPELRLRPTVRLRPYQDEAVRSFVNARNGVVLLPCGAGKTVVGVAAAAATRTNTLVLTNSRLVAEQWRAHFQDLTTLPVDQVGILENGRELCPVTIATYHAASATRAVGLLLGQAWGLVIYDEVQSLPADVFRLAAQFPGTSRLGLTATLVREDGREREIAGLVGPVIYDVPWLELEQQGWIAPARCVEVRVPRADNAREASRFKMAVVERLIAQHQDEPLLVIGTHLELIHRLGRKFRIPTLTGATPAGERAALVEAFRSGAVPRLALSRVGTVGLDLPDASVLIQISGTFGSRQEEAQRLGRILRPAVGKSAVFYTVVIDSPRERRFADRRRQYLVDQGYEYELLPAAHLPRVSDRAR
ncbi:MAG: restriction endonuclease subunit R [Chloroflexi bacterium]|nr:MAG: restriction endonuclease subunit R [Chloroflexota bacterium]